MYLADTGFIFECQRMLPSSFLFFYPHESGELPLHEFPRNFILGTFTKISRKTPNL